MTTLRNSRKKLENIINETISFAVGDLVVHYNYGIGRFTGLETVDVLGIKHDFLVLVYDGGNKLYIPVENIELLSRYVSDTEAAILDKLGGTSWQIRKARLQNRIKLAAEELLKTAAEREIKTVTSFSATNSMYEEFCAKFPYIETDDQLSAIKEIEEDLAAGKPMDRLVCGDVGFGKTEVALRAAFIVAVAENSLKPQVAVIVPSTLLARQHYLTFKERFTGFPIKIALLSRMVSDKEAAIVKQELANGSINIIVGTHAILNKNIEFKNLQLIIIDEEHHFGVAQKERLKQLRFDIHILTLSATPIPRTLQMLLVGIKKLSLITTPPIDRIAVRTFIMPFDGIVIKEAILREYNRGGKIFYVCPKIADLAEVHDILKTLVPSIRIIVAHGQMHASKLDDIMNAFCNGEYDLLLSTLIVESGLDIANANTIIVHRADVFGLAQLYQLRGRVGRGKIRAYAYLTLPIKKILSKTALARLEIMRTLDSLGAGFSLASYDMDLRGFGNLVGEEQSGHIKEVGVELYRDMLKEAVEALVNEKEFINVDERN